MRIWLGAALLVAVVAAGLMWRRAVPDRNRTSAVSAETSQAPRGVTQRALAADRHIAGVVRSPDGPVEGAEVRLVPASDEAGPAEAVVTSGDDGAFDLGYVAARRWVLLAEAPERSPARLEIPLGVPADALELVLERCVHRRAGVVVDAAGAPVAGARVVATLAVGIRGTEAPTTTDATGRFVLCVHAPPLSLGAIAAGHGPVTVPWSTQRIVLPPEGVIAGRVVAIATGEPVPDADVHLIGPLWSSARSDGGGRFTLRGLPAGSYRLTASGERWAADHEVAVEVHSGATTESTVGVHAVFTIRGRVVSGDEPIAARVVFHGQGGERVGGDTADGSFAVRVRTPGERRVEVPGREVISPTKVVLAPGGPELLIRVAPEPGWPATIRGRVLRLGAPVVGAEISDGTRFMTRTVTGADGRFQFGADAGSYRVDAYSRDLGACSDPVAVTVAEGDVEELTLELAHAASVAGTVVNLDGVPVPRVAVGLARRGTDEGSSVFTRADGTFYLAPLVPGDYVAVAHSAEYRRLTLARLVIVSVPRSDSAVAGVRLVVDTRVGVVAGRVVHEDGRPAAGARISVEDLAWADTDADGRFRADGVPLGLHAVQVSAPEVGVLTIPAVETGREDLAVTLPARGVLAGRAVGFAAAPRITVTTPSGRRTVTAVDGQFTLTDVAYGDATIRAEGDEIGDIQRVMVAPPRTEVVLRAGAAARVVGRPSAELAWCEWSGRGISDAARVSLFRFDVSAGSVRITCQTDDRVGSLEVAAVAGRTTDVVIPLRRRGRW